MTVTTARPLQVPRGGGRRPRRPREHRRPWRPDVVGAVAWLSVLVVVALWVAGGGAQALAGGTADALTSAGRLLGLVASDLLLLQCVVLARIPWAERAFGRDQLTRWHRVLGFTSFWAMVAHAVVITTGYAAGGRLSLLAQAEDLLVSYPGMLLAAAGSACLVMVVVTSVRAARRRLRYESWHLMHLYAYLGCGLALPHQVWTGSDFVNSPWARAYWWSLWSVAALSVVVFRLGVPAWHSWARRLRVAAVTQEAPGVVSLALNGRRLDRLGASAGQFLLLRFLDGPGWSRANPYSLSAAPHPEWMRVTIADAGDGSARAAALRPGTRVLLEGPMGRLTLSDRTDRSRPVVLLGAGVGITPLRALLEAALLELPPGVPVALVQRARRSDDVLFAAELAQLAADGADRGAAVHLLVGPRARAGSWLPVAEGSRDDAAALRHLVPWVAGADVYVCGPPAWADAARRAAVDAGVPRRRVHEERFTW